MSAQAQSTARPEASVAWRERSAPFAAEVAAVTDWEAASPCAGWTARDVLAHVIDTQREFLGRAGVMTEERDGAASADAPEPDIQPDVEPGVEQGVEPAVEQDVEQGVDAVARWDAHLAEVTALLDDPDIAERPYDGAFGPTTVGALMVEFYGFDLLVHRWDLSRSQGREARLTAQELALVDAAVDGWGEHAYAPGIFARPVAVPEDADEQTRVLARTGRCA